MHEMLVYCAICDFIRNKQVARLTHRQIAELLGSEDKSESPNISRRTIQGLVKKGFIEVIYQGHEGSANHYALLKTPYDIFLQIDKEYPDYFSDAQRTAHVQELKLNNVGYGKPAEAEQQPTPEAETTMTVDAHNWENREEDIRKQALIDDDFGGYVLHRGDWLVNFFGDFLVMSDESMHPIFKEVEDA